MDNESRSSVNLRKPIILTSLSAGVMSFLLTIYSKELNMNAIEITGLFSVLSLVLLIMKPIIGKASDKFGRRPILITAMVGYAIAYGVFSMADSSIEIYIARILQGFAAALMTISTYAIISDTTKEENFSEGFGKRSSASSTGILYGIILTFIVFSSTKFMKAWQILFIIFSLAAIYGAFYVIKKVPETKNGSAFEGEKKKKLSIDAIKILIISFITSLGGSILGPIFMIYLLDKFNNDITLVAYAYIPSLIIESILSQRIGKFSDNNGKKRSMIIGIIVCGVVTIITPGANSVIMLAALWCFSSIGGSLYNLSEQGIYTEVTNEGSRGEMYGVYTMVGNCAGVVGPLIGGVLYETVSHAAPFYLNGAMMFVVAGLTFVMVKNKYGAVK
ncbi:MAG: MFS transporter [Clostridium sp.]|uniref:MFS transporter n=1 Tax=Clostridium sp. TaxID=1506 RepID=UPI0030307083